MKIIEMLLTPNEYSRPKTPIRRVMAIVMHWTANPNVSALNNRNYFEAKKTDMGGYGSAHYIIGLDGEVIRCIPENEIAYHCGSNKLDPVSGRTYTDEARKRFGHYALRPAVTSPNYVTLGVELCPIDDAGHFSDATIVSAVELCAKLIKRHKLTTDDITTHHAVVGWKNCPKLWTDHPDLFEAFKASVADYMARGNV